MSTAGRPTVIASGLAFPEGLAWDAATSTVIVSSVAEGAVYRLWPQTRRLEKLGDTLGGANGAAVAEDGGALVAQNGGIDARPSVARRFPDAAPLPAPRPTTPGLQWVSAEGTVTYLADRGLTAPNDVTVGPDGTILFTDPGHKSTDPGYRGGRIMAYRSGVLETVASGFWYCNGIQVDRDGQIVVTERDGLVRIRPDRTWEWLNRTVGEHGGDGFCLDAEGRFYVAAKGDSGVRVLETDGTVLDFLPMPQPGMTSNCCFGGPGLRWLFATDAVSGEVMVWDDMPTRGLAVGAWPVAAAG
ncbi:MAG TPA: SMP-30/gluconolactonase/LRE family protein [Amycolatopsis sp.]|nr:SMP-30/gluconolactonase/LRE family protein [Amycolatopsis sp.]